MKNWLKKDSDKKRRLNSKARLPPTRNWPVKKPFRSVCPTGEKHQAQRRRRVLYMSVAPTIEGRSCGRIRLRLGLENQINPNGNWGGVGHRRGRFNVRRRAVDKYDFHRLFPQGDIRLIMPLLNTCPCHGARPFINTPSRTIFGTQRICFWDTDINPAGFSEM